MTWDIGPFESKFSIPIAPDPIPIPIADVIVRVNSGSGLTQAKVVQRRKPSNVMEVHVNKGTTVKLEIV